MGEKAVEDARGDRPIGEPVPGWQPRKFPERIAMEGRFCRLEPLDLDRHAADLHDANRGDRDGANWTYLSIEAPADLATYRQWLGALSSGADPVVFAVVDRKSGAAIGIATYLRIDPANGTIEVGHINFSPLLQRRPAATEAMYLMMRHVFEDLGYRRYEWKCDSLNAPSRRAAARLGFTFEGIFRQAVVYKSRNRDTAWFSVLDGEWRALKAGFERWLDPANFDAAGRQVRGLAELRGG